MAELCKAGGDVVNLEVQLKDGEPGSWPVKAGARKGAAACGEPGFTILVVWGTCAVADWLGGVGGKPRDNVRRPLSWRRWLRQEGPPGRKQRCWQGSQVLGAMAVTESQTVNARTHT